MSKRNLEWNQEKYERYIKEGRGKGVGSDYKPWLTTQDFPSLGRVWRVLGWKTGRMQEFMSDNELRYFYLLDWSDNVIDIREQYPLLNLEKAMEIADELGIIYPRDRKSKTPIVPTTDFFITINLDGKEKHIARTIKPSIELEKKRTIEKFEIERRYWEYYDIDWGIVTEKDIPKIFTKNIEWIYNSKKLESDETISMEELLYVGDVLKQKLTTSAIPIRELTKKIDKDMNLPDGTSLYVFRHLIATKQISINMVEEINLNAIASEKIMIAKNRKEHDDEYHSNE